MLLSEALCWLTRGGCLLMLHLSARSSFPMPLAREEEQALLERLSQGDREAASALIEHNLRLVVFISKKYDNAAVDQEETLF